MTKDFTVAKLITASRKREISVITAYFTSKKITLPLCLRSKPSFTEEAHILCSIFHQKLEFSLSCPVCCFSCFSDINKTCLWFWYLLVSMWPYRFCQQSGYLKILPGSAPFLSIIFKLDRKHVCLSWNSKGIKILWASWSLQPSYPLQIIGFDPDSGLQHDDWCSIVCISSYSHDLYIQNLFDLQHAFCAKSHSLGASWFLLTKLFTKKLQISVLV